jgi:hypothetical protein
MCPKREGEKSPRIKGFEYANGTVGTSALGQAGHCPFHHPRAASSHGVPGGRRRVSGCGGRDHVRAWCTEILIGHARFRARVCDIWDSWDIPVGTRVVVRCIIAGFFRPWSRSATATDGLKPSHHISQSPPTSAGPRTGSWRPTSTSTPARKAGRRSIRSEPLGDVAPQVAPPSSEQ